ncbi:hypothetical protein ACIA3K_01900 [Micromonospora sp. NPDC051543]|uniref:hypothetical protein n=1 Tax=Micromonospora sp. NPDC051543 TaxID=3364287 RepID=UPI00379019C9
MHVSLATSAGRASRPNEDFIGAVPGAVVLLDGAGIPGSEALCAHGVAWYTHRLGGTLLGGLSRADGRDLAAILADAIAETAAAHRATCDIADPSSPQATVLIARAHRGRLEHLLLADSYLMLEEVGGGVRVVTDEREVAARRECAAPLAGSTPGTPEYDHIRASCALALRARRNQPGGYWIAKDDPRAAWEAVTGSHSLDELHGIALLSNGASRIVGPYGLTDWRGVRDLLASDGPSGVLRRVREFEDQVRGGSDALVPDDATVAHYRLVPCWSTSSKVPYGSGEGRRRTTS